MNYSSHLNPLNTPQTAPIAPEQVKNNAGGFVFTLDKWKRLERFLILGNEGGTYYAGERALTLENAKVVTECVAEDPSAAVELIVSISVSGRAPKNDPAIFALAVASITIAGGAAVYPRIPEICRTGTHLFQFVQAVNDLRGWSRGLRRGVANWYLDKEPKDLEYQLLKYKQRGGWTHRDVLRLCHARTRDQVWNSWLRFAVGKETPPVTTRTLAIAGANLEPEAAPKHILTGKLTREMLPTTLLNKPDVWEALLADMPMHAMVRNLAKMTAVGLLATNFDSAVKTVCARLNSDDYIKRARLHPVAILNALRTYVQGHGEKGKLTWKPVQAINEALDAAFYKAFAVAPRTGKNFCLGLDISGSMDGTRIAGTSLTAREGVATLALVQSQTETCEMLAFSGQLRRFNIGRGTPLGTVAGAMRALPHGATDCALPILAAMQEKWPIDVFVIYTDNETWFGKIHPMMALKEYRQRMGRDAKLVVVGMTSTGFTIADPNDGGSMDCVGFDTNVPALIADFVGNGIH